MANNNPNVDFLCPSCGWKIRAYAFTKGAVITCANCSKAYNSIIGPRGPQLSTEVVPKE